jgi:multiple sugar transport system permease protein
MGTPTGVLAPTILSRHRTKILWENLEGWLWASPFLIGFLLFIAGPFAASLFLAFTDWDIVTTPNFVGLENFIEAFSNDSQTWHSLEVTTTFAFTSVPLSLIVGLVLALLLNAKVRGLEVYRTVYYLPAVISGVAVAYMWKWILTKDWGVVSILLSYVGIQSPGWLTDPAWALPSVVMMSLWSVGGAMVIYLAGLQGIPTDLYEAAEVDGANWLARLRHVTLPMMTPVLFFQLVMGLIGALQVFTSVFILTNGGPQYATNFFMLHLYQRAFKDFRMGYGSALAWILFIYIMVLTLVVLRTSRSWVYYEGELKGARG